MTNSTSIRIQAHECLYRIFLITVGIVEMRRVLFTWAVVSCVLVGPTAALPGNEGPLTDAGLDQTVERGTIVVLDATGSRDPDGTITSYRWTIETPRGRVITPADPTQPRTTFRASELGRYRVSVVVTDDTGASTQDTLYVTVNRNDASESTEGPTDSPTNNSRRTTPYAGNRTDTGTTDTDTDTQGNDTEGSIDDEGNTSMDTDPPIRDESTTVEVVRYVAEDIDMDVTAGQNAVNDDRLAGASDSKSVDYRGWTGL